MLRATTAFALFLSMIGTPFAGECPADKVLTTPRKLEDIGDKDIKRLTLAEVKLEGWRKVGDLYLRMRRLTIGPGGFVPTHQHDDRPSIVYIIKGQIIEHSALCAVPIPHKAGEWTPEFGPGHAHWWEVVGNETVVLISADVISPDWRDPPGEH